MANYLISRVLNEIFLRGRLLQLLSTLILLTNGLVVEDGLLAQQRTVPPIFTKLKFAFFSAKSITLSNAIKNVRRLFTDGNLLRRQGRNFAADMAQGKGCHGCNSAVRVSKDKRLIELLCLNKAQE